MAGETKLETGDSVCKSVIKYLEAARQSLRLSFDFLTYKSFIRPRNAVLS